MGVIRPRDQERIKALPCASALKTLLMTTDCGLECFTVKISSQQAKHLAVLRLTVNATEKLTNRLGSNTNKQLVKDLPGIQNCPFVMVNVFYDYQSNFYFSGQAAKLLAVLRISFGWHSLF